jgi:hypothetical protein
MQPWTGQNNGISASPRRNLATTILIVCAVSGLIMGFAIGGVTGRAKTAPPVTLVSPTSTKTTVKPPTPTATAAVKIDQKIGDPSDIQFTYTEKADGTTSYTFSTIIVDKNAQSQGITAPNVTCKLWLTQDATATAAALKANNYAIPSDLNKVKQNMPSETPNAPIFSPSTPQVETCATHGQATSWTYTLPTTLPAGQYHFFVFADWEGNHYNWHVEDITVTAAG